ncbi:MAG: hypothetical protein JSV27_02135 [Candidatus Bathyarchaeota archaeon]|nr:MAG: hypothetical protein JSV27_02135 [Candidatus Bathyarchaeota archaeon]
MATRYPLSRAKKEVKACIETWREIFEDRFGGMIECAYAKGSCVKEWGSPIDYVPLISDVDIHVKLVEGHSLFDGARDPFDEALEISTEYEEAFLRRQPDHLHVPRTQIVVLNPHLLEPDFFLPSRIPEQNVMIGDPQPGEEQPAERIREIDLKAMLELGDVLRTLPMSAVDRVGVDLVPLIRRLTWRVSPTPVRLLSQLEDDPYGVWERNRTSVCEGLERHGYGDVSRHYREYYLRGWEVFRTEFRESKKMREMLASAYRVLRGVHAHALELSASP